MDNTRAKKIKTESELVVVAYTKFWGGFVVW